MDFLGLAEVGARDTCKHLTSWTSLSFWQTGGSTRTKRTIPFPEILKICLWDWSQNYQTKPATKMWEGFKKGPNSGLFASNPSSPNPNPSLIYGLFSEGKFSPHFLRRKYDYLDLLPTYKWVDISVNPFCQLVWYSATNDLFSLTEQQHQFSQMCLAQ